MVPGLSRSKSVSSVHPVSATSATYTGVEIDTKGFRYLDIVVSVGAIAADMTALKLTSSDTAGSGHTDIPGMTFAAADLPKTATSANTRRRFQLPLKGQKRYVNIVATAGAGATLLSADGFLSAAEEVPDTAAKRGYQASLLIPA